MSRRYCTPIGPQLVEEGSELAIPLAATDPDGKKISLQRWGSTRFLLLTDNGNGTGAINCLPGLHRRRFRRSVTITAVDDGIPSLSDVETFTLTVVTSTARRCSPPLATRVLMKAQTLTINLSATDPDGDAYGFSASALPGFCSLSGATISCNPGYDDAGSSSVTVTVSDAGTPSLSDSETFTLTVGASTARRCSTRSAVRRLRKGRLLSITLSASDPDGDALSFSGEAAYGGCCSATTATAPRASSGRPTSGRPATWWCWSASSMTAPRSSVTSKTFTLSVGDVNRPPVLDAIRNQSRGRRRAAEHRRERDAIPTGMR